MLSLDISSFQNSVDPDQLASEKPADHGSTLFSKYMPITGINLGRSVVVSSMVRVDISRASVHFHKLKNHYLLSIKSKVLAL